jgi:hypothetical protein
VSAPQRNIPELPTQFHRTYSIRNRPGSFRKATCAEVECEAYLNGWTFTVQELSEKDYHLATNANRHFETVEVNKDRTLLVFPSGQPCFAAGSHKIENDKPKIYLAGRGDFRMFDPRKAVRFNSTDFLDKWASDMDKRNENLRREGII